MPLTYNDLRDRITRRTGLPRTIVSHVLDAFMNEIEAELMQQGSVHLRGLFKLAAYPKAVAQWGDPEKSAIRIMLSIRPVRAFRHKLNSLRTG